MKKILLLLTIFLGFIFNVLSQNLSEPKGGGTLNIVSISPDDGHSEMNFEGNITGYGLVFVKFKVLVKSSKVLLSIENVERKIKDIINDFLLVDSIFPRRITKKNIA